MRSWCQVRGLPEALAPSKATLIRRRGEVTGFLPDLRDVLPRRRVVAIDGIGFELRGAGRRFADKHRGLRRHEFDKLHVCVVTGIALGWVVTPGRGPGSGDVSVGPDLLKLASQVVEVGALPADQAYDAKPCWSAAGRWVVCEPKSKAAYGLHPDRDQALAQIGKVGPVVWKERRGYHGQSLVESAFGALKKRFEGRLKYRRFDNRTAEISAIVGAHNLWLLTELS